MPLENAAIELRSVNRLLVDEDGSPARYWIPAYQRGYRWTQLQVNQLLDDIWDFIQASEGRTAFYCLQPLVIRKLDDGRYEVVDGQQRLTTIFILLSYRDDIVKLIGKQRFSINYETRDSAFLTEIDLDRANENVDFHHICEAWKAIEDWLNRHDSTHALKLLQHLLYDDEAGRNVKVIWYELAPGDDPVAAFTRLNIGKIPLTEAELIRALFLRRAAQDDSTGNLSLRIAYEWDQIEKRLQDDAVWYFLQNAGIVDANRIGLIFRLAARMADRPGPIFRLAARMTDRPVNGEDYGVFSHFAKSLKPDLSAESEWLKVKEIFMVNRPGFTGECFVQMSGDFIEDVDVCIEGLLSFLGRDVCDGAVQALGVVPADPFQGFPFDLAERFPRAKEVDDFGFEQANDALGQCVIVAVADAAD